MKMILTIPCMIALLLLLPAAGFGQRGGTVERDAWIRKLQQYFDKDGKAMSYRYVLTISGTDHKSSQTLAGYMQVAGAQQYDSCQAYIQVRNREFVFQANRESRVVSLVRFSRYKALTGMDPEQSGLVADIPLAALDTAISFRVRQSGGQDVVEFDFKQSLQGFRYIRFRVSGSEVREVEMSFSAGDTDGDGMEELYTLRLYDLKQRVDERLFGHGRFYKIQNGKVTYAPAYKDYKPYEVI